MARALGINTRKMTVFGLMLSNALIALAGAILAQNNGYADVNSGLGTIVIALAAIIIGKVIFCRRIIRRASCLHLVRINHLPFTINACVVTQCLPSK